MGAASVRDVAAHAGVSVGTVSNVLNQPGKVAATTVARVQASIAKLGFVRNDAARQLRAGRSNSIGLVVPDVRNPFFTDVARGAEDRANDSGLSILLGSSDASEVRESTYLDLFEEQRVYGVLISPQGDVTSRLVRLRDRGIPAVLVDRSGNDGGSSSVSVDDVAGGRLAVRHLLAQGRDRIAFVAGNLTIRQVADRLAGAHLAIDEHPGASLEVIEVDALTVLAGRAAGQMLEGRSSRDRPDGIFAANDLVAIGVLQALVMAASIIIPDDIALVGYDDIDFAMAAVVPLTSVRQPSYEIGSTAVQIMLDEAADPDLAPRQVVFQPELVVRRSTVAGVK